MLHSTSTSTPTAGASVTRRTALAGLAATAMSAAAVATATPAQAAAGGARITRRGAGNAYWVARHRFAGRVPYVYGGSTPRGFDCSGMTKFLYATQGCYLPRSAREQYRYCRKISRAAARSGDLVFFSRGGRITHVGIYAGGNMMVDAGTPSTGIRYRQIYTRNVSFGTRRY